MDGGVLPGLLDVQLQLVDAAQRQEDADAAVGGGVVHRQLRRKLGDLRVDAPVVLAGQREVRVEDVRVAAVSGNAEWEKGEFLEGGGKIW